MILAAHQPQFAPWLGYFDKMDQANVFVLLDNVQYKKNEWQNRNRIKSPNGPQWLTVPVSFHFKDKINQVNICHRHDWPRQHAQTLRTCYSRAPHFEETFGLYQRFLDHRWRNLAELSSALIRMLAVTLGLGTSIVLASDLEPVPGDRNGRLVEICQRLGADTYLAGEGGRAYMDVDRFQSAGLDVLFQNYRHPTYPQLFGEFTDRLSVLDLLFNCAPSALEVIRRGRPGRDCEEP